MTKLLHISSCYDCKYCEFGIICRHKGVGYDGQFIKGAYIPYYDMYPGRRVEPLKGIPKWCPLNDIDENEIRTILGV